MNLAKFIDIPKIKIQHIYILRSEVLRSVKLILIEWTGLSDCDYISDTKIYNENNIWDTYTFKIRSKEQKVSINSQ